MLVLRKLAVNIKTKQVVSMDVSSEKVHDSKRLKRLVNRAKENGVRVKTSVRRYSIRFKR